MHYTDEGDTLADIASANSRAAEDEPLVFESIGNGVNSKLITPKDEAIVKCAAANHYS